MKSVYILDTVRTPRGKGNEKGALYGTKPVKILASCLSTLVERTKVDDSLIAEAIIGCVTPRGVQGGNIAKASLLRAGLSYEIGGMQINRSCTSGLEAINLATLKLQSGQGILSFGGGVEIMSQAKMSSDGGPLLFDLDLSTMVRYVPQGIAADLLATLYNVDRETCDEYAYQSHKKAYFAQQNNYFDKSIIPYRDTNGLTILAKDSNIRPDCNVERLSKLPSSFEEMGIMGFDDIAISKYPQLEKIHHIHTAGNSSAIVDGASAVLLGTEEAVKKYNVSPRAKILGACSVSTEPTMMLKGAEKAIASLLKSLQLKVSDIDLWEINESFAASVIHCIDEMKIDPKIVNVNGGAIAMGHPLGATGSILLSMLIDELERTNKKYGVVAISAGAGLGSALAIELC